MRDFTREEETVILQNSLERILTSAAWVAERADTSDPEMDDRSATLLEDLKAVSRLAQTLWWDAREGIMRKRAAEIIARAGRK